MGLISSRLAQGVAGAADAFSDYYGKASLIEMKEKLEEERQMRLLEVQAQNRRGEQERGFAHDTSMVGVREQSRREGRQSDIAQDTSPENIAARGNAANQFSDITLPTEVKRREALLGAETTAQVDRFTKLAPLQRQEAIDTATAQLQAMSTPEMLAASRKIAQAKHIVDPSYTLIPNADGTVTPFDSKSGRSGGVLTRPDGSPIIRKDPEELKAATAVINMASANLRIAQAEHKAALADMPDPVSRARAEAEWNNAQAEARRITAPAYAVLYGKAGIPEPLSSPKPRASTSIVDPFKTQPAAREKAPAPAKETAPQNPEEESALGIIGSRVKRSLKGWNDAIWGE